jgi:hypothetical protein
MVGSTGGRIFKISIAYLAQDASRATTLSQDTLAYLTKEMGTANEHSASPQRYIWDAKEGNVILEHLSAQSMHAVNVFLTSSIINKK